MRLFVCLHILWFCTLSLFLVSCTKLKSKDESRTGEEPLQIDAGSNNAQKWDSPTVNQTGKQTDSVDSGVAEQIDLIDSGSTEQISECTDEGTLRCDKRGGALRERCEGSLWVMSEAPLPES